MILLSQRKVPCSERKLRLKLMRTNCVAFLLISSEVLFLPVSIELGGFVESVGRWGMGPPNEWIPENNLRGDHISSCFVFKSPSFLQMLLRDPWPRWNHCLPLFLFLSRPHSAFLHLFVGGLALHWESQHLPPSSKPWVWLGITLLKRPFPFCVLVSWGSLGLTS